MSLLRERGELQQKVEWAGRTNDMKKEKLTGLEDVYQGGRHEDKLAADIEQALTERDEFGRVLTPKERFRRLCHKCGSSSDPPRFVHHSEHDSVAFFGTTCGRAGEICTGHGRVCHRLVAQRRLGLGWRMRFEGAAH